MKLFSAYLTRPLLLLSAALCLSSCGLIGGDSAWFGGENGLFAEEGGYQTSQVIPDMRIPAELDSYTIDQLYVIPEPYSAGAEAFEEIPLPRPIEERRREAAMRELKDAIEDSNHERLRRHLQTEKSYFLLLIKNNILSYIHS